MKFISSFDKITDKSLIKTVDLINKNEKLSKIVSLIKSDQQLKQLFEKCKNLDIQCVNSQTNIKTIELSLRFCDYGCGSKTNTTVHVNPPPIFIQNNILNSINPPIIEDKETEINYINPFNIENNNEKSVLNYILQHYYIIAIDKALKNIVPINIKITEKTNVLNVEYVKAVNNSDNELNVEIIGDTTHIPDFIQENKEPSHVFFINGLILNAKYKNGIHKYGT